MNWAENKRWADKFIPQVKQILGYYLIGEIKEEDCLRNTDLIVLKLDIVRVACRIRRYKYLKLYPDEFTLRESVPSGNKTELDKIIEGWGDYFFYGFANEEEVRLHQWYLFDLDVFRSWLHNQLITLKCFPGELKENYDFSSKFRAFKISELPPNFIIAKSVKKEDKA